MQDFYTRQSQIAGGNIAELEQEVPADPEEAEDIQQALAEARAFKAGLDSRGPFVSGVTVRLGPAQAAAVSRSASATPPNGNIKSIVQMSDGAGVASIGSAKGPSASLPLAGWSRPGLDVCRQSR